MPFFSIIIPTYNRAEIIDKTIQSVVDQQYTDWELIIVDDGGSDDTKKIVEQFNDNRIHYFWKNNEERGVARNFGTKKAKGQYVFFLDSDDLIYSNHLQHAFNRLNELHLPEFFHSRYEEVFTNKTVQVEKLNQQTVWKTIQKQNKFACQFFLRHDVALQFPFLENRELKIGEDWLVVLQIGLSYQLNVSNQINSAIVQHNNRSMQLAQPLEVINSRDIIISELNKIKNSKRIISNVYFELTSLSALAYVLNQQKIKGIKTLSKLFLQYPFRVLAQRRTFAIIKHLF